MKPHLFATNTLPLALAGLVACAAPPDTPSTAGDQSLDAALDAPLDAAELLDSREDPSPLDTRDPPHETEVEVGIRVGHDASPTDLGSTWDTPPRDDTSELAGWCTNEGDQDLLGSADATQMLEACNAACAEDPTDHECWTACASERFGLSAGCAGCQASLALCAFDRCGSSCLPGAEDAGQCECLERQCELTYRRCAGIDARPEPDPLVRYCGSEVQMRAVESGEILEAAARCHDVCRTSPRCFADCLEADGGPGPVCGGCLSDFATCGASVCRSSCADAPFDASCRACAAEACDEALTLCLGVQLPSPAVPLLRYAERRWIVLASGHRLYSVVHLPSGAPAVRGLEYGDVDAFVRTPDGRVSLGVTAGSVGPGAPRVAELLDGVLDEGRRYSFVIYDRPAGGTGILAHPEDPATSGHGIWRIFNGLAHAPLVDVWLLGEWPSLEPLRTVAEAIPEGGFSDEIRFEADAARRLGVDTDADGSPDVVFAVWSLGLDINATLWLHTNPDGVLRLLITSSEALRADVFPEESP